MQTDNICTIAQLLCMFKNDRLNFEEIVEKTKVGKGCGMCIPYIHTVIKTEQTSLPINHK
jgi:NAD(P)H-nitrite reductase large subunit